MATPALVMSPELSLIDVDSRSQRIIERPKARLQVKLHRPLGGGERFKKRKTAVFRVKSHYA